MSERYKSFPPGLGHLWIPTSSRAVASASLALYTACKPRTLWLQRAAELGVRVLGPWVIPGRSRQGHSSLLNADWDVICSRLRQEVGDFDTLAFRERTQISRPGLMLLLFRDAVPVAFVKLRPLSHGSYEPKVRALELLGAARPPSFSVVSPLAFGDVAGWHYVATTTLPPGIHRVAERPPIRAIAAEIQAALEELPRPAGIPTHWLPMHGDFTPWNLRELPDGNLVLFDWEDAGWGPPGADEVLYRATAAALQDELPQISLHAEAANYWQRRVAERTKENDRDRRISAALDRALVAMQPVRIPVQSGNGRNGGIPPSRARVLVFAYACEPDRGSEPGAGWGLVSAVAEFADCVVLVGPEHSATLREWKRTHPESTATFIEVSEPRWAEMAKHHRIPWFLLYLFWMRSAYRTGLALHQRQPFDAVYHATYSTYWLPSAAMRFDIPTVWGPVGGGVTTPRQLWSLLGWQGLAAEWFDWFAVRVSASLPSTRRTWRRARQRILQNEATRVRLPRSLRASSTVLNHVMFIDPPPVANGVRGKHLLCVSHLESRKGAALAIRSLAYTSEDVVLIMVGDGPERHRLERLAQRLGVGHRVHFRGSLMRTEIFDLLGTCAAAVFTGLREEGGVALAEAMLCGTPIVVLAHGGARTIAEATTDPSRVALVLPGSVEDTARAIGEAMTSMSRSPSTATGPLLDQEASKLILKQIFAQVLPSAWTSATSPIPGATVLKHDLEELISRYAAYPPSDSGAGCGYSCGPRAATRDLAP